MRSATGRLAWLATWAALAGCASSTIPAAERTVRDDLAERAWRPAVAADLVGHWRARRIEGPAAAALMDVAYWIDADGHFSGAALFTGPPPTYQVLSGRWSLAADGVLQLGEDAAPARAEVAEELLRVSGDEGALVFERARIE